MLAAAVGLFVYEPSPKKGFTFSSAGKTLRLSEGRDLGYLEVGDPAGHPVFYFHGGPGSRLEGLLLDEFSRQLGVRMIAVERPGYGLSDTQKDRTYLDWPDDVAELADHLGIDRFAVLGWSSGGPYAAAAAHAIPRRLTVAAIVAGEGPYAHHDYPQSILESASFNGSDFNKMLIWSARNGQWLMRAFFRVYRILIFRDPSGLIESSDSTDMGFDMPEKDIQFFTRDFSREYSAELVEAFRHGVDGLVRDFTIERLAWPFELEKINSPTVLVFHGDEDTAVHPGIGEYVCERIPTCDEATIYPGEGHSVVYYRYKEIIQAMLEAWE
jgi:pimeloyl-ACP methyl ester carboxylesterase